VSQALGLRPSLASSLALILAAEIAGGADAPGKFAYAHEAVPTGPNDVAVAARGAIVRTDSFEGRYHPLPMIDGDTWDKNGYIYTAWFSGAGPAPHWVEITFGRPETVDRVTIYWADPRVYYGSIRYSVCAWVAGAWREVASQDEAQTVPSTTHTFAPVKTQRIRIEQPPGGGHPKRPNAMWIREVEVCAVSAPDPLVLPSNLLKQPTHCKRTPKRSKFGFALSRASFIPGSKGVALIASQSGIKERITLYLCGTATRSFSVRRDVGPIPAGGRARVVFDLPDVDGTVTVLHPGWLGSGYRPEEFTVEEVRVVTEAEPPKLWAVRDRGRPWRVPRQPHPNATNVPLDAAVKLFFDDQLWLGSLSGEHFKLLSASGQTPCRISYDPWLRQVTLAPENKLAPNTTYLVGMSAGVRDLRGNRLHNRPGELDGYFFSTGPQVEPDAKLVELLGTGGIQLVEWPVDLRVSWVGRVIVNVPAGAGKIEVSTSPELKLVDRTSFDPSQGQRKFYFRAVAASREARVELRTPEGARASVSFPVLTLAQELSPRRVGTLDLPRRWPLGQPISEYKKHSVFHPRDQLDAARQEWIKGGRKTKTFKSDEFYYNLVPPTWMQRNTYVNQHKGCPVHGDAVRKVGRYGGWKIDPVKRPYQVQCPVGGEWYPSNKIAEGDFTSGDFPDDGLGYWQDGECYHFVGWYNHALFTSLMNWFGWTVGPTGYFLETGEQIGARKAMVLLYRLAEEYGHLAAKPAHRMLASAGPGQNEGAGRGMSLRQVSSVPALLRLGMIRGCGWGCVSFQDTCKLYDAIFEGLIEEDRELIAFLNSKNPDIRSMADIRRFFEDNFIRVGAQAFIDVAFEYNEGGCQESLMTAALVAGYPEAKELVDWVFTGRGQFRYKLANSFFRDGAAFESVGYNVGHVRRLYGTLDLFGRLQRLQPARYPASDYPDVATHPKYRAMFRFPIESSMLDGAAQPSIGDAGAPSRNEALRPRYGASMHRYRPYYQGLFRTTRDPLFAQVVYGNGNPNDSDRFRKRLLYEDPKLNRAVDAVIAEHGALPKLASQLFDGYGLAMLRSGEGLDKRTLWLSYSQLRGHPHRDMLQIGYCGKGREIMRCLGYPRSLACKCRTAWEYGPFTHYRGYIWPDAKGYGSGDYQELSCAVRARCFVPGAPIQIADVGGAGRATPNTRIHRRTVALIDLSPSDSYVVDVVRMRGGTRHFLSVPGIAMHSNVTTDGLRLVPQEKGTLAGEDIAHWDTDKAKTRYGSYYMHGLSAYHNVSWSDAREPWWVDWRLDTPDAPDLHLRYRQAPLAAARVALADGTPHHQRKQEYKLRAAHTIREGAAPLVSQFVGTYELYERTPLIDEITRIDVRADKPSTFEPIVLRIRAGDQEDVIVAGDGYRPQRVAGAGVALDGELGVVSRRGGKLHAAVLVNGTELRVGNVLLRQSRRRFGARITAVDYALHAVAVSPAPLVPRALVGEYIVIATDRRQTVHRVVAADAGKLRLETDPLIGEGVALRLGDHQIATSQKFFLSGYGYYDDAVLCGESGRDTFRLLKATQEGTVYISPDRHPEATASELAKRLVDGPDRGAEISFHIYDYGIGDKVTCFLPARITRIDADRYRVRAHQPVTLMLPLAADAKGTHAYYRYSGTDEWQKAKSSGAAGTITCEIGFDATTGGEAELRGNAPPSVTRTQ